MCVVFLLESSFVYSRPEMLSSLTTSSTITTTTLTSANHGSSSNSVAAVGDDNSLHPKPSSRYTVSAFNVADGGTVPHYTFDPYALFTEDDLSFRTTSPIPSTFPDSGPPSITGGGDSGSDACSLCRVLRCLFLSGRSGIDISNKLK